jgi:uncharacterized protein YPO0396
LDFAAPAPEDGAQGTRAGFRLHRLEVYNWGTFHGRVWSLDANGDNALLTGDIGSGKSTLVDAITTLLVPAHRIVFNKAAGADKSERNLRSYVLGHFKSARENESSTAKAVSLRDQNSYSVILARFENAGFAQQVTLAQVFWMKGETQPVRFFVVADGPLSITPDFSGFGKDIQDLKKRLRRMDSVEVHDSFTHYAAAFRRRFGIANEQALELFNQTVSMKSVGDLTDFVRQHMLEPFAVEPLIQRLITHFDDLRRAHEAVLTAKAQIGRLTPLVEDCRKHSETAAEIARLRECREALESFFAQAKSGLLARRLENLEIENARFTARGMDLDAVRRELQTKRDGLKRAIADNGGDRLERLRDQIAESKKTRDDRLKKSERYDAIARAVGLPTAEDGDVFIVNRAGADILRRESESRQAEAQNRQSEAGFELRRQKEKHDELQAELASLRGRRSNIPGQVQSLRVELCKSIGIPESALPFAGELMQVRENEKDWEGAIERVMRGFGLSLLVADRHYAQVAEWVDRTHLRNRLVYFRVREAKSVRESLLRGSLIHKIALKTDSPFYNWLDSEVARRFDYVCCESLEDFRRESRAITRSGQIKQAGERHEKDDRHRIEDRSQYVLGWSNEAKIAALESQARELQSRMGDLAEQITRCEAEAKGLKDRLLKLQELLFFENYQDFDWKPLAVAIEQLEREKRDLEAASDVLRTLEAQLAEAEAGITKTQADLDEVNGRLGENRNKQAAAREAFRECTEKLDTTPDAVKSEIFPMVDIFRAEALGDSVLTVESCEHKQKSLRDLIQARIDAEDKRSDRIKDRIIAAMASFAKDYPAETREIDAHLESAPEFESMLARLQSDDLPRFEETFKQLLNENTIREIAQFQSQLERERRSIKDRIEQINGSLRGIDYNAGTYIRLEASNTDDTQVRDFQQDLKACTEGAFTGSDEDAYSDAKFLQVKRIIERFRGREGSADADRRWMEKVTDVRNWFEFSASERWQENDGEHEHYSDSGGKSGGQKEKLAYTILAASLAYQFGIEAGTGPSRTFRFVVIDEAFGRGSDESAKYGLELFKRLGLQLLIVTPLQKIHIIEPYVAAVGFVYNEAGKSSFLRCLTIEEYRREKAADKPQ